MRWARHHPPPRPRWAIPAPIVGCESSFTNEPPNSASAAGYYQITAGTWDAYNGPAPADASQHSKAEQDAVAGRIYRAEGTGPWVSSEPCWGGRV